MSRDPQLPDDLEPLPAPPKEKCLDAQDCRAPVQPGPQHAPVGKR